MNLICFLSFFLGKIIAENEFKFAFLWESNDIILPYLIIINKQVAVTANFFKWRNYTLLGFIIIEKVKEICISQRIARIMAFAIKTN